MTGILSATDYDKKLLLPASWPTVQLRVCQLRPGPSSNQQQCLQREPWPQGDSEYKYFSFENLVYETYQPHLKISRKFYNLVKNISSWEKEKLNIKNKKKVTVKPALHLQPSHLRVQPGQLCL